MDFLNNSGETQNENTSGKNEVKGEKRIIFELTNESFRDGDPIPEDEKTGQSKDFLEKLHLRNHEINSVETIHELYREEKPDMENDTDKLPDEDEYLFKEVGKAFAEKDIIDLRANLQAISKSIPICQFDAEDIEKYLDKDLDPVEHELIQNELQSDVNLANEIDLYREIDEAIGEKDIMKLRSGLHEICLTESSQHLRSIEEIEDYLSGELDEHLEYSIEDEISINQSLASEVRLFNEINEAISEKDVMNLRLALSAMGKNTKRPEMRGIRSALSFKLKNRFWYAVAASVVVFIGINIFFYDHSNTNSKIYSEFYQPAVCSSGTTRSRTNAEELILNQALTMLNKKEYDEALKLFSDILDKDNKNSAAIFYTGTIYQMKGQYADAIQLYSKVAENEDNLFTEQSNWYIGLCYLKIDQRDKAIDQFKKISAGNGYYRQQSISILEKLE
jgi:tetratricopeptide (TPR) repeat protein